MNYIACIYGGADYGCQPQFILLHVTWLNCQLYQRRSGERGGVGMEMAYFTDIRLTLSVVFLCIE